MSLTFTHGATPIVTASRPSVRLVAAFAAHPERTGALLGLVAATIWGAYLALARAGVVGGLGAADIAAIRYAVAGIIMLPWLARGGIAAFAKLGWRKAIVLALLAGPPFILLGVGGYEFAPLAHGAVIQPAVVTIGSIFLAFVLLGDRPTLGRSLGVVVIVAGLATIAGPGLFASTSKAPLGDLMFGAAGAMWAAFTVIGRFWGVSPLAGTGIVSVVSAVVYLPLYLALVGTDRLLAAPVSMLAAQILVQGVLSGVVAVIAYSRAVQLLGAGRAAVFPALVPAVAILLGVPATGETPTVMQVAGLAVVSTGLLFALNIVRVPFSGRKQP